jgi:hypothetical protein
MQPSDLSDIVGPKSSNASQAGPISTPITIPIDLPIESLFSGLVTAKETEALAKTKRIRWEERIAKKLGGPEDGQETTTLEDGSKVTISRGFNFSADCEKIRMLFVREQYDSSPPIATKTTVKLDEPAYKEFARRLPNVYKRMTEFVTVKPKKISVTLTEPKA